MRFLFVDQIDEIEGDRIRGRVHFPQAEPLRYNSIRNRVVVAPGAVSEAIGQLASWMCIDRGAYQGRPVFLFADRIQFHRHVDIDSTLELNCQVANVDEKTFSFSGDAKLDGETVATIINCNGYFMPLEQLEDPQITKQRFQALSKEGLVLDEREGDAFSFTQLIDDVIEIEAKKTIVATKSFSPDAPFFADHFPRFPVTPIVMLNEMIGCATKKMMEISENEDLIIREVSGIKIKSFVKPNEPCVIKVKRLESADQPTLDQNTFTVVAELHKDNRRILRGRYVYQILGASND